MAGEFAEKLRIGFEEMRRSNIDKQTKIWYNKSIKNGVPAMFKQGPGSRFFDGKENTRLEGVLHTLQEWITDEQKLEFLQRFGWLMKDAAVGAYSAKFKPIT